MIKTFMVILGLAIGLTQTLNAQVPVKQSAYVSCMAYTRDWKTVYITNAFEVKIANTQDQVNPTAYLIDALIKKYNLPPNDLSSPDLFIGALCNGPGNDLLLKFPSQAEALQARQNMIADANRRGSRIVMLETSAEQLQALAK